MVVMYTGRRGLAREGALLFAGYLAYLSWNLARECRRRLTTRRPNA